MKPWGHELCMEQIKPAWIIDLLMALAEYRGGTRYFANAVFGFNPPPLIPPTLLFPFLGAPGWLEGRKKMKKMRGNPKSATTHIAEQLIWMTKLCWKVVSAISRAAAVLPPAGSQAKRGFHSVGCRDNWTPVSFWGIKNVWMSRSHFLSPHLITFFFCWWKIAEFFWFRSSSLPWINYRLISWYIEK